MRELLTRWDALYESDRHRLRYPSEHVVRWLASLDLADFCMALDIGCGAGRHMELMRGMGLEVFGAEGCDNAVKWTKENALSVAICDMTRLTFEEDTFDVALAYGVFYYGTPADADQAVQEMHRVLKPGGHGFVCVRSRRDWRYDHLDAHGIFHCEGNPEDGMLMDFITEADLHDIYGGFAQVSYETCEWTTGGRDRLNSDWLISVVK